MKKYVRLLSVILIAVMLFALCPLNSLAAASAKASISLSATSVYVGNTLTVSVTYSSSAAIGGWNFSLIYDSSVLQYVSGADSHSSGTCRFANVSMDGSSSKSKTFSITFKAIAAGTASLSTSTREIVGDDYSTAAVTEASRSVTATTKPVYVPSTVNTLDALKIEGVELTPAFDKGTYEYTAVVEYPVKSLTVTPTVTSNLSTFTLDGTDALEVGENTVTVTVKAESGAKQNYVIKVTRNESIYSAVTVDLDDGSTGTFPLDFEGIEIPEGFTAATGKYGDKEVLTFINDAGDVRLAALIFDLPKTDDADAPETEARFFVYDQDNQILNPYIEIGGHVLLPFPDDFVKPDGYEDSTEVFGDREIKCLKNSLYDPRYSMIYASGTEGAGTYIYDSTENTIQSYMTYDGVPTKSTVDKFEAELKTAHDNEKKLSDEVSSLEHSEQLYKYICFGIGALALILLVCVIILAVKRRKVDFYETDDYDYEETSVNRAKTMEITGKFDTAPKKSDDEVLPISQEFVAPTAEQIKADALARRTARRVVTSEIPIQPSAKPTVDDSDVDTESFDVSLLKIQKKPAAVAQSAVNIGADISNKVNNISDVFEDIGTDGDSSDSGEIAAVTSRTAHKPTQRKAGRAHLPNQK